jgi:hypothetical protein
MKRVVNVKPTSRSVNWVVVQYTSQLHKFVNGGFSGIFSAVYICGTNATNIIIISTRENGQFINAYGFSFKWIQD